MPVTPRDRQLVLVRLPPLPCSAVLQVGIDDDKSMSGRNADQRSGGFLIERADRSFVGGGVVKAAGKGWPFGKRTKENRYALLAKANGFMQCGVDLDCLKK